MTAPLHVTDADFKSQVLESDIPVLVDFWAEWCPPCKQIAPIVEDIANEYGGRVKVVKVDVDSSPTTAGAFSIFSIPTLMLFEGGEARERVVGYQPKAKLVALINAVLPV